MNVPGKPFQPSLMFARMAYPYTLALAGKACQEKHIRNIRKLRP